MTLFDFGAVPSKKTLVRQFVVRQPDCGDLGQILINGAQSCEAEGRSDFCGEGLRVEATRWPTLRTECAQGRAMPEQCQR
ncbi:hypothetical protein J5474_20390 [Sagittula sp. M10.9X]|uniref:Uncharacterized protein n=1 Tax=Sagittula salina TaxID=2820268 RepID=A0A940MTM2_9RHOB|nr:hypothetical protein [Sagittula salina]MBP0484837.1 hypothetical protein [Sagittula salina]